MFLHKTPHTFLNFTLNSNYTYIMFIGVFYTRVSYVRKRGDL